MAADASPRDLNFLARPWIVESALKNRIAHWHHHQDPARERTEWLAVALAFRGHRLR
jgi:hypothetical protein